MGFFLAELGLRCFDFPDIPYRGIDRLPVIDNFEGEYALHRAGEQSSWQLWNSYWAADESGDLSADLAVARNLCAQFSSHGIDLEVIYAELTSIPTPSPPPFGSRWRLDDVFARYERVERTLVRRPDDLTFYGFDLSRPLPTFHSIIRQPGFRALADRLPPGINEYGLIGDNDAARGLLESSNGWSAPLPVCVIEVWGAGN